MAAQHSLRETEIIEPPIISESDRLAAVIPLQQAAAIAETMREEAQNLPTIAEQNKKTRKYSDRNRNFTIAAVALIAVIALALGYLAFDQSIENKTATDLNSSTIQAYGQAIEQLRASGVPEDQLPPPLPVDPTSEDIDVNAIVQAARASTLASLRSDPAFRAQAGVPGTPGVNGVPGAPCDPETNPLCRGPEGNPGTPGTPGTPGEAGTPGTPGAPGTPGTNGKDGSPGRDAPFPIAAAFVGTPDNCVYRTTYQDRATNEMFSLDAPTDGANCL